MKNRWSSEGRAEFTRAMLSRDRDRCCDVNFSIKREQCEACISIVEREKNRRCDVNRWSSEGRAEFTRAMLSRDRDRLCDVNFSIKREQCDACISIVEREKNRREASIDEAAKAELERRILAVALLYASEQSSSGELRIEN